MILWNTSDDPMRADAPVRRNECNGPHENVYPPGVFIFAPNERLEIADMPGNRLLEILSIRGLVRLHQGDDEDAVRRQGRREYFRFLEKQVRRHRMLNQEQRLKGLPGIEPNDQVLICFRKWKQLKKTEFGVDEILASDVEVTPGPIETLVEEQLDQGRNPEAMEALMGMTAAEAKTFEDESAREAALGFENLPANP